jgi:hypothetical protein
VRVRGLFAIAGLAVFMATARTAIASPVTLAAAAFREGEAATARGDYATAARHFDDAHALAPHFAPLLNAAIAWEKAGNPEIAADRLQSLLALPEVPPGKVLDARSRLSELENAVVTVEVRGPIGARVAVAHRSAADVPFTVHLAPGRHETETRVAGTRVVGSVEGAAGTRVILDVTPVAPLVPPVLPPTERARDAGPNPIAFGALGVGAAGLAAGVTFGALGLSARGRLADDPSDARAHGDALRFRTFANIAYGVGALGIGAGVALVVFGPRRTIRIAVAPTELTLSGRF